MITPVLPTYNRAAVSFVRGEGARVFTEDGTAYLDFGAGVAVNSCGHAHPHLVNALTEQAKKNLAHFQHLSNAGPGKTGAHADREDFCRHGVLLQLRR